MLRRDLLRYAGATAGSALRAGAVDDEVRDQDIILGLLILGTIVAYGCRGAAGA